MKQKLLPVARFLPFFCLLLFQTSTLKGQSLDSLRINLELQDQHLPVIFDQLETQYGIQFYYAESMMPMALTSVHWNAVLLPDALRNLLKGTDLGFFFYRDYGVGIAPQRTIETDFAAGYYAALQALKTADKAVSPTEQGIEVIVLGDPLNINADGKARVKGQVLDEQSGEGVSRAELHWSFSPDEAVIADGRGNFELTMPVGQHKVTLRQLGYDPVELRLTVYKDGEISFRMMPASTVLAEAEVRAKASDANVSSAKIGTVNIDPKAIKKLPTLMGEVDVVRSLLLVTGVTSAGEGAAGFNVRGGEIDQNLMLQDEVVLFNSSHALGFFSSYNADLVQSIDLHKSIIPAQYGGRLASILDVQIKDGDFEKWKIKGGIGPVSGRLSFEGPVSKNKASVIGGFRASYSDWILDLTKKLELKRSSASFYDANLRYTHRLNAKNTLIATGYVAADEFIYNHAFGFDYQTTGGQLTYKHFWGESTVSRLSLVASNYKSTQTDFEGADAGTLENGIRYLKLKEHLTLHPSSQLQIEAGAESNLYWVSPGEKKPLGTASVISEKSLERETGLETALFGSAEWKASSNWLIVGGLRINHYRFLGPKTIYAYDPFVSPETLSDTLHFGAGKTIAKYWSLEPRFSARFRIDPYHSIKAGYSRTSQFVNQIFNSDSPTPTSQYQLSTNYLEPFRSHNVALGFFRNSRKNQWELASEVFYRAIDRLWDYRDFAKLVTNETLETEIRFGKGRAYGLELSAKTTRPVYNGQVGYTFSRAERKVAGISRGAWYPSNFDKPHILNLVFNYQPSQRHTWTLQFTYSTGRPTTAPLTNYRLNNNIIVPVYAPRNQVRIPDYHRLDLSYTIGRGYNKNKTLKTSWNFSVYNVYGRKNAFSVFFEPNIYQQPVAKRLAILGSVFPAITLNIETI
ncbi:MAG: TonB-dependent receptor domain-containing protein [Saprospiraceae bacterium]